MSNSYNFSGDYEPAPMSNLSRAIDWSTYMQTGDYNLFSHPAFGAVENQKLYFQFNSSLNKDLKDCDTGNRSSSNPVSAVYASYAPLYQCISARCSGCPVGLGIDNGT